MDFNWKGGDQGVAIPPPPNGQSHSAKCSATVLIYMYVEALIYIAKRVWSVLYKF